MSATVKFGKFHPKKNHDELFFHEKKKKFLSDTSKMVVFAILRPDLRPFLGIQNFFSNEFNLLRHFFGVKFTGKYFAVDIIP